MTTPETCQTFARYNTWMNGKLYAACADLDDATRKADRGAYFKSLHGTLDHILLGDRIWMNRFTGNDYPRTAIGTHLFSDFEALAAARRAMDAEIEVFATGLTPDWLARPLIWTSGLDGTTRSQPGWLLVSHLFNHQTHHRGQATTLLSQLGVDIGSTDLPWLPQVDHS
ncbi:DinB family protein [Stappia stellulata]|uniref:DinB family protein n=1 Tax=Stappia stellulata TaxID=71235 RepID=UPI00040900E3|nr:DinB family protein [Stappia stellulata]